MGGSVEWQPTWYDWFGAIPKSKGTNFRGGKDQEKSSESGASTKSLDTGELTDAEAQAAAAKRLFRAGTVFTSPTGLTSGSQTTTTSRLK